MDCEANKHMLLEDTLLYGSAVPMDLPLSFLKVITDNFSDHEEIGSGGFAKVYKGRVGNRTVAVKKPTQTIKDENFEREVKCLMKVQHKNIVRFLGYCADTQGKFCKFEGEDVMAELRQRLLCFEYMERGSLDNYIKDAPQEFDWTTRYQITVGICEGLHYLHQMCIVHSDLKPANILLDNNMVPKISDFGLSRCFHVEQSHTITANPMGTQGYMAPEFQDGVITYKSDIYSLGVIMIELLTGQKGYHALKNVHESWKNNLKASHGDTHLEQVIVCAELATKCIQYDPEKRPDTQHIIDRLYETESNREFIHPAGFSASCLTHADMQSTIEFQPLIRKETTETNSKVQNRKFRMQLVQDPNQANIILGEAESHVRAPRLLRIYEYYRCIPYSTRVKFTCGFIILSLAIMLAILVSAYGAVHQVTISIEDASLRRFSLSTLPITALAYNISLTIAVRNPNWAISIENIKSLEASFKFEDQMFDRVLLSSRGNKQGPGTTRVYRISTSSSRAFAALGDRAIHMFEYGNAAGVFHLEIAVTGMVRYTAHITKRKLEASCPLILQQYPPRWPMIMFDKVQCKVALYML